MTREEAIKNIKAHCYFAGLIPQAKESLDMAIKALEQELVLDKIRAELHATAELHEDGGYCIRDEWIDEYFDKYKAESEET